MRQINVTKKVKVAKGEALVVDLTTEEIGWVPFEVRNIEYPLVDFNEQVGDSYRGVAVRNVKVVEKRYGMPLDMFIAAADFSEEIDLPVSEQADVTIVE